MNNVILFGETGAGKSSLVNMLIGCEQAATSDSAIGCTFESSFYCADQYKFFDTAGLSEGTKGQLASKEAFSNLVKLLKNLKEGVNLLIFVIEMGRIKQTVEENYKLFVETICMKKVPVILVITGCEGEENLGDWWIKNKTCFDDYGMSFADTISGCASNGEGKRPAFAAAMAEVYAETRERLWESVTRHALLSPWKMISLTEWLTVIIKKIWNTFASLFKVLPVVAYVDSFKKMFLDLGHTEGVAVELSNALYNQMT